MHVGSVSGLFPLVQLILVFPPLGQAPSRPSSRTRSTGCVPSSGLTFSSHRRPHTQKENGCFRNALTSPLRLCDRPRPSIPRQRHHRSRSPSAPSARPRAARSPSPRCVGRHSLVIHTHRETGASSSPIGTRNSRKCDTHTRTHATHARNARTSKRAEGSSGISHIDVLPVGVINPILTPPSNPSHPPIRRPWSR